MSENQDIRVWAKSAGIELGDRGRIPKDVREQYAARNGHQDEPGELDEIDGNEPDFGMPPSEDAPGAPPADKPAEGRVVPERRPQPVPRKRRGLFSRDERKPKAKPGRRRVSVENLISSGWELAAMALVRSPQTMPVGRVLAMQAPVAGVIIDDAVKGTAADKFLQPFARAQESSEKVFAMVGPPLLVGAVTARPELFPVVRPILKASLMSWVTISRPAMDKAEKKAQAFAEEFGQVDLDGMIDALFADIPIQAEHSQAEEDAIRRARGE